MKSIAHAWIGLMALERLKTMKSKYSKNSFLGKNFKSYYLGGTFDLNFNEQAKRFVKFFDKHKDAFVKGAWFPDSVIQDNLVGGHTFKLKKPSKNTEKKEADVIKNQTPDHLSSKSIVQNKAGFKQKVVRKHKYNLPDRCEALSHAIRDMMKIKAKEPKGSDIMFNDDQLTLYFLMLSHYLADAHVPPHCDNRDFYKPSKIHPDMEKYWDDEIKRFYTYDRKRKVFDYDINGAPELINKKIDSFKNSLLYKVMETLSKRKWNPAKSNVYGKNNAKIYDYIKACCFVSYLVSVEFIPMMSKSKYEKIKILKDPLYKENLTKLSVHVLADAIDSIAFVWLITWCKLEKLETDIKKKTAEIKKKGGTIVRS